MLTRDDIQNGNVLSGPNGDRRVGGRVVTDAGQYVLLVDDTGHADLIQDGLLYDHEEYTLKNRLAADGIVQAQEASQVDALRSEVERQSRLIQALLDRDAAQQQVAQQDRLSPDPVPTPEPSADPHPVVPPPVAPVAPTPEPVVPGPAAIPNPDPATGTQSVIGAQGSAATGPQEA